jgi:hypothetical protein
MVYFYLGLFWRALQWKMLVHFMTIWNILRSLGVFYGRLVQLWPFGTFFLFWYVCTKKNPATLDSSSKDLTLWGWFFETRFQSRFRKLEIRYVFLGACLCTACTVWLTKKSRNGLTRQIQFGASNQGGQIGRILANWQECQIFLGTKYQNGKNTYTK